MQGSWTQQEQRSPLRTLGHEGERGRGQLEGGCPTSVVLNMGKVRNQWREMARDAQARGGRAGGEEGRAWGWALLGGGFRVVCEEGEVWSWG